MNSSVVAGAGMEHLSGRNSVANRRAAPIDRLCDGWTLNSRSRMGLRQRCCSVFCESNLSLLHRDLTSIIDIYLNANHAVSGILEFGHGTANADYFVREIGFHIHHAALFELIKNRLFEGYGETPRILVFFHVIEEVARLALANSFHCHFDQAILAEVVLGLVRSDRGRNFV